MKIKTNLKSIWIITILSLGLFIFGITQCKAQPYVSFSFDANKLFNLKDNSRTEIDWKGLDYDFEVGAIDENIGVYLFYGAFPNAYYDNYGVGVDYYLRPAKRLTISLGNYYSKVMRKGKYKHLGGAVSFFNPRFKLGVDTSWITIELIAKLQSRGDIDKRIFEGSVGVTKKFNK